MPASKKSVPSRVWFTDIRARSAGENKVSKIEALFKAAGFAKLVEKGDLTAVKLHFGEPGNDTFIGPVFVRKVVELLKAAGANPFLTDTNTLYSGLRHNAVDHLNTATAHGFTPATVGAPVVIADGLRGNSFRDVRIKGKHFKTVSIADGILDARSMIVLSHFKGHIMAGFGGAIKNLAMGCAPSRGKCAQHASRFSVDGEKCTACGRCMAPCPQAAISWAKAPGVNKKGKHARIDKEQCVGCGECMTLCRYGAISIDWKSENGPFNERMAEYAYGAVKDKPGRVGYINFLLNITPDCDCVGWSDIPLVPDIGILASHDPVALDKACYDLVNARQGDVRSRLTCNHEPGADKFKGAWSYTDGGVQLAHAEALGLGKEEYELVDITPPSAE